MSESPYGVPVSDDELNTFLHMKSSAVRLLTGERLDSYRRAILNRFDYCTGKNEDGADAVARFCIRMKGEEREMYVTCPAGTFHSGDVFDAQLPDSPAVNNSEGRGT